MASVSHHLWPCLVPDSLAEVDKSRVRLSASMRGRFIISVHPITRTLCVSRRSSYVVLCTTIRWYYDIRENAITVLKMFTFLSKLSKLKLALLALRASRVYASNRVIELETVVWSESSGKEGGDSWAPGIPEIVEHCSTGREKEPGKAESEGHARLNPECRAARRAPLWSRVGIAVTTCPRLFIHLTPAPI